jgi:hypothetical protein
MQAAMVDRQMLNRIMQGKTTMEIFANIFREYAHRIAFGSCPPGESSFVTLTYGQAWERIQVCRPLHCLPGNVRSGFHKEILFGGLHCSFVQNIVGHVKAQYLHPLACLLSTGC